MTSAVHAPPLAASARGTLVVLSVGNFVVGIAAFAVLGLMSTITRGFGVDPSNGSWLITAYAVSYAIGSPLLIASFGRVPRRIVVTGGMLLVALGSLGCSLAPSLGVMEWARVLTALGAGLYSPAVSAIAVSLVPAERRGWALSQVFIGFTASQGIGNASGTWFGYTFGYQWTFLIIALLAVVMTIAVWRLVPAQTAFRPTSLIELGRVLATPRLLVVLLFTVCFVGSTYTTNTYLTELLERRAGLTGGAISLVLLVYGGMAFVAAILGSRLIDRLGPTHFLYLVCALLLVVLPLVTQGPSDPVRMTLVLACWSLLSWSHFTAQQSRLVAIDQGRAQLLLALNSSMLYVGIAVGSLLAGRLLPIPEFRGLAIGGEAQVLLAVAVLAVGNRMVRRANS